MMTGFQQRLINKTVTVPSCFTVMRLRQGDSLPDKASEGIGLRECLTIELVYPLGRAIRRNHDQRHMLIISLCHSWSKVQQGCTAGDTDGDWLLQALAHAQGIEACRALIRHRIAFDIRTHIEIMHDGRISAPWAQHRMPDPMRHQQTGQYIYVLFIAIHILIYVLMFLCLKYPAWFQVLPPSPAIPVPPGCP